MNRSVKPKVRIFLVGCPRSGTTLLQSLLAAHPQIASFPEAHFFRHLLGGRKPWQSRLRMASPTARDRFLQFLEEVGHPEMKHYLPPYAIFTLQYVWAFLNVLDDLTLQEGKNIWLEKTPSNLHYISYIEKRVPNAKFIHIIRNGSDVVASLYEVTHKYPEIWSGAWDIDRCIQQWVKDVKLSRKYVNQPNHILVSYEDLVNQTQENLEKLCDFIGISFNLIMIQNHGEAAQKLITEYEPWKASVNQKVDANRESKFNKIFNENQQDYILKQLSNC
ncbi:MAG: sulfotransferase [Lyngbya sp.]|nr:sulfotransferase [Lyngbya sp.]